MTMQENRDYFINLRPHEKTCEQIKQALLFREGVVKVIGDPQIGKTTLFLQLQMELENKYDNVVFFPRADMSIDDLDDAIIKQLDISVENDFVASLSKFLFDDKEENEGENKNLVLFFDDAHQLAPEVLAHIRILTNLQDTDQQLVRVVLFGEQSLDRLLNHPRCYGFVQRVTQSLRLAKITRQQWLDFINHEASQIRLSVKAAQYAYSISKGKPQSLAIIATLAGNNLVTKKELRVLLRENGTFKPRLDQKKALLTLSVIMPILVVGLLLVSYLRPSITMESALNSGDAEAQRSVTPSISVVTETQKAAMGPLAEAIAQWEMAWQQQDVNKYLATYSSQFSPQDRMTLERWSEIRALRVSEPDWIKLSITHVNTVQATASHAEIEFWLSYESSDYQDKTLKKLMLEKENEKWLIVRETNIQLIKL
ncbi:MAG: type II secretory pathway predicted ATPase ExeA [Motiliproteus sp.]|jgi:type II secretory pathway predicted ATPase ExeA